MTIIEMPLRLKDQSLTKLQHVYYSLVVLLYLYLYTFVRIFVVGNLMGC